MRLADEATGNLELSVAAAAGPGAQLAPDAERAVRALLESPPLPVWDNRLALYLLAGLLTIEWALRKRFKLL